MRILSLANQSSKLLLAVAAAMLLAPLAYGNSCTTQSQMKPELRHQLVRATHLLMGEIQTGDIQALRGNTLSSVAANFNGIAESVQSLKPDIQHAAITVDTLIAFDAQSSSSGPQHQAQFFCSPPNSTKTIVLTFPTLPAGNYALAIAHATGVPKPQQVSLILARTNANEWTLAGLFSKPLTLNGQSGTWYWSQARQFARQNMTWAAWYYFHIAKSLVRPANFLSSPNLNQLEKEASQIKIQGLPSSGPVVVDGNGAPYKITKISTSTELGPLDLVVHYTPDSAEAAALQNPAEARRQVLTLMTTLLAIHPGLRKAFHGLWVFADSGSATAFALELPMKQIPRVSQMNQAHTSS